MNRRTKLLVGAAALATVVLGAAFLQLRGPQHSPASLLAGLDAFTGEWAGEASIETTAGQPLHTMRATRRYSWVGDKQIVETSFWVGTEEQTTRSVQWIEGGRLRAIGTDAAGDTSEFAGGPTADGILWSNVRRPKMDRLDRLVGQGGKATVQSACIMPLRLGNISDLVVIAAVMPRLRDGASAERSAEKDTEAARVAELERKLADVEQQREFLRARLAHFQTSTTAATNAPVAGTHGAARSTTEGGLSRPSQFEIRSSPSGMKFEVWTEDVRNLIMSTELASGFTPVTLENVPPGDYAVILQGEGQRKTVHHVTVHNDRDMFLFHRDDGGPMRAPAVPLVDTPPRQAER